jgi:hypothetical protein
MQFKTLMGTSSAIAAPSKPSDEDYVVGNS